MAGLNRVGAVRASMADRSVPAHLPGLALAPAGGALDTLASDEVPWFHRAGPSAGR